MTNIQIDGQIIKSTIDRSNDWAKVYGRPVSVIRAEAERTLARYDSVRLSAVELMGVDAPAKDVDAYVSSLVGDVNAARKTLSKISNLADGFIIWEKAGYNSTQAQAINAKPHNGTPNGTIYRVVKVSDVMVD